MFKLGPFEVAWHGLFMMLGIVVATVLTARQATKAGIPGQSVYTAALWIVLLGLIGARIVHVLDSLDVYSSDPVRVLAIWEGGLSWYGGLLGGIVGGIGYAWIAKMPIGRFIDTAAPAILLGLAIGRIGCTLNGDAYGTPTSLPWGIIYTNPGAFARPLLTPLHPVAVYEIIWDLAVAGALWMLRGRLKPDGSLFLTMLASYSFGRFLISWIKAEEQPVLGPLHQAHIISLIMFAIAVGLLLYRQTRIVSRPQVPEGPAATEPPPPTEPGQNQGH
ncbi:MAG: prolipoprotein diacylglyceryl transferase [Chloroflexi bacterium]|nr:prolipoprotein diacylglyceryl transferase [Chloroflexota bacterium]